MGTRYTNLEELKRKKELLKKEVSEMEELITFKNAKESLSAFSNGLTDNYLQEIPTEDGDSKIALNKDAIVQKFRAEVKQQIFSKKSVLGIANTASRNGLVDDAIKLGITTLIGSYAKKNMNNSNWKKKIIGIALVYLAPIALRFLRKKLDEYQKNRSVTSMEQLI